MPGRTEYDLAVCCRLVADPKDAGLVAVERDRFLFAVTDPVSCSDQCKW